MFYLGFLGHSHIRRLHRHWHPTDTMRVIWLPGHSRLLQYMHIPPTDAAHYSLITTNHPHMTVILISWGDNDFDQPGDTISSGITYDIARSLISLLLYFIYQNITVFILPPLPRTTPSLTTHPRYTSAAMYISQSLARQIADLRIPYSPLISPPSLAMSVDGIHFTTQAYENLRLAIIRHISTQRQHLQSQGITVLRSSTPLLPTPNTPPDVIIYLPSLPNYVNHRDNRVTFTTSAIATTTTTPTTSISTPLSSPSTYSGTSTLSLPPSTHIP